jgi:hypothetical protein
MFPCQGKGRRFKSGPPLKDTLSFLLKKSDKILGSGVMVTRQSLELVTLGSNPSSPTRTGTQGDRDA